MLVAEAVVVMDLVLLEQAEPVAVEQEVLVVLQLLELLTQVEAEVAVVELEQVQQVALE